MSKRIECFYAYPSQYDSIVYTIKVFANNINDSDVPVKIKLWQSLNVSGKFILNEVRMAIDDCDVFLCDLTYRNMNVLFELGYAIAQNKRIWISMNEELSDKEKLYKELGLITTIGYDAYTGPENLITAFLNNAPFNDLDNTLYNKKIQYSSHLIREPKLIYLCTLNLLS